MHYFSSSILGWNIAPDIDTVIKKQKKTDARDTRGIKPNGFSIYKVPCAMDAHYGITNYEPDVPGTKLVKRFLYRK